MPVLWLFFFCLDTGTGESYRLKVQPLDFQDETRPETFMSGIKQIESNGRHLFLMELREPGIVEIDQNGTFIRRFGDKGNGPEDLGHFGSISMAVQGNSVWVINDTEKSAHYFESGEHLLSFPLESYQMPGSAYTPNVFSFTNREVLIQTYPRTKHLAAVYGYDGKVKRYVGEILPIEPRFLTVNPALNATYWVRDTNYWYCLFKYRPFLRKFDHRFRKVAEMTLIGPEIDEFEKVFWENEKSEKFTYPKPHFRDFKIFGDHLYAMSDGVLYQIDKETGNTLSRTIFYGAGPTASEAHGGVKLHFGCFAIVPSAKIILVASHFPWDHDLWTAELPFLK